MALTGLKMSIYLHNREAFQDVTPNVMAAIIASTEREELRLWNLDARDRKSARIATADFPPDFRSKETENHKSHSRFII